MRGIRRVIGIAVVASLALTTTACVSMNDLLGFVSSLGDSGTRQPSPPALQDTSIDGYLTQQVEWEPCGDMECATVAAPLNWAKPNEEAIALRMVRAAATGDDPIGSLFVNPGGPGASGVSYVRDNIDRVVSEELRESYTVIGWDPRGVGESSAVTCLNAADMDEYLFGDDDWGDLEQGSPDWVEAVVEESAAFVAECQENTGELLGYVDTMSTVQDLDMMRSIVGDEKLNFLGFSYGTYIGARYADRYPENVGRLVLDGAIDPSVSEAEVVREQTKGFESAMRAYVADCLERSSCPLRGSVDNAMAEVGTLLEQVDAQPLEADDGRVVTSGTLLTAIITPLYSEANWPYLDQLITTMREGDPSIALFLADFYYDREPDGTYTSNSTEAFYAINCLDYPRETNLDLMEDEAAELEEIAPTFGKYQGYGGVGCWEWPEGVIDRGPVTGAGADPIVVIGTTGDPATPYLWAESLADQLQSGTLITYEGEGHTAYGENECVDTAVDTFLLTGTPPEPDLVCK